MNEANAQGNSGKESYNNNTNTARGNDMDSQGLAKVNMHKITHEDNQPTESAH